MALVEKTSSKKLVKNAWNLSKCAFSTSSVKYVVELEAYRFNFLKFYKFQKQFKNLENFENS